MHKTIVCLDIASKTGFAVGVPGSKPRTGVFNTAGTKHGEDPAGRFLGFAAWLNEFLAGIPDVGAVFYEGFLSSNELGGKTTAQTMFVLVGLAAHCEMVCRSRKVSRVERVNQSSIRSHFLGKNFDRRADPKALVMKQCRLLGWEFEDNNAADAAALFSYASAIIAPKTALETTPLFGPQPSARELAERAFKSKAQPAAIPSPGLIRSRLKAAEAEHAASGPQARAEKLGHHFSSEIE